eukprot:CAMPEP_0197033670 /NCGR_PEP_ID=MMETSP1384-20130603/12014_1 /TAXON_ID=29189 /ORGANISM="Ammonia sp." /LENGTH=1280 /DNA_ID=CAMNT_0042463511 /DNA_START=76 /DNA_END=3918 /DNA_ORIENTATION=+
MQDMGNLASIESDGNNLYSRVHQESNSVSDPSMLGDDVNEEDDIEMQIDHELQEKEANNLSPRQMYQRYVLGDSPSPPNNNDDTALLRPDVRKSRNRKFKKRNSKYWKSRHKKEKNAGNSGGFSLSTFLSECFNKNRKNKKVIDSSERSIDFNYMRGPIKCYRDDRKVDVSKFNKNAINNQRYSLLSFFPVFLYEQFNQFWNLWFLFVAITQLPIPGSIFEDFWIGFWWTTVLPLAFVTTISMLREAFDDIHRKKRDYLINYKKYQKLSLDHDRVQIEDIASCKIQLGDLIVLKEGDRVPCDMILLYTENKNGTTYIKTDQLDGETDWKLRKSIASIQKQFARYQDVTKLNGVLSVEPPQLDIYRFIGKFTNRHKDGEEVVDALNLENTLWSSTIIASEGVIVGCCVYLGAETRQQLNANPKQTKYGKIDQELNRVTKLLVALLVCISFSLTMAKGVHLNSYLYFGRFLLILSDIIPLSLRVYMDMSKIWFSVQMQKDPRIAGTTVRCTTIPEELGRIQYIFSDKTGTLTQNRMIFQKLQLTPPLLFQSHHTKLIHHHFIQQYLFPSPSAEPTSSRRKSEKSRSKDDKYSSKHRRRKKSNSNNDKPSTSLLSIDELQSKLRDEMQESSSLLSDVRNRAISSSSSQTNKSVTQQVTESMAALALCHNVTPIQTEHGKVTYEASSPDEIAMVKFTARCGVKLIHRSTEQITLRIYERVPTENGGDYDDEEDDAWQDNESSSYIDVSYDILNVFPFTSESKRMGIIIKCTSKSDSNEEKNNDKDDEIIFYAKGADVVMKNMIESNEWMDEEVENLSREGLRTLVFAKKRLTQSEYGAFLSKYNAASVSMNASRKLQMESIRSSLLEQEMELLCVTGVEDKLQDNVQSSIEILRNAQIKMWMLTGDKMETAKVIARSSRLLAFGQELEELSIKNKRDAYHKLDILYGNTGRDQLALIIDGKSLDIYMNSNDIHLRQQFLEFVIECDVVINCRCSPTQKAEMVEAVQMMTNKICLAIGDGGNDVSMILAANVGVGIVGVEGQQAALSADFSIYKFEYLINLLLWHGRLAYKNTSLLSQFVIHRGLIIAFITVFFNICFYFASIPLFTGALMVGYTCVYTSLPVFTLVLDKDVSFKTAIFYPELYHSLQSGLALNNKTLLLWIIRSFYQGAVIMLCALILFEDELHNIVSITFTALILTELYNVYLEIHKIHLLMVISELLSILLYVISVIILSDTYFDKQFVFSLQFYVKSLVISVAANVPVACIKFIHKQCNPSMQAKLKDDQH